MENGNPGLLCAKTGGSTRLIGVPVVRRFVSSPMRLCLGDPRLRFMGVELLVFGRGDARALRTEGIEGEAVGVGTDLDGEAKSEN